MKRQNSFDSSHASDYFRNVGAELPVDAGAVHT
jgi:hypothetical protein